MQEEHSKELEQAKINARSIPGGINKYQLKFLGTYKSEYHDYYYYKDSQGNYYYENDFDREMELKEQERRKQRLQLKSYKRSGTAW